MPLSGFGFSGYRSFGDTLAKIAPLKKVNLIIGQNNSGKSNIIRFLHKHYKGLFAGLPSLDRHQGPPVRSEISDQDRHQPSDRDLIRIAFPVGAGGSLDDFISECLIAPDAAAERLLRELLNSDLFLKEDGIVWFVYAAQDAADRRYQLELDIDLDRLRLKLLKNDWFTLWRAVTGKQRGGREDVWPREVIRALGAPRFELPHIEFLSDTRKIGEQGTEPQDFSGPGIIRRLFRLQHSTVEEWQQRERFEAINGFVRDVLERADARMDIPHDESMIIVSMDGKRLPLTSLGTGVHQTVLFAAAATVLDHSIICIEEPELHLHPSLQRKLLRYLHGNTTNQYIFTTHSAHILDCVPAQIFHVRISAGDSTVSSVASSREKTAICSDLGYRASDLLQTNCVIWVEGPSDRIYLNYWLRALGEEMVEGVHYAIMFYGGILVSHLSGLDPEEYEDEVSEFISLRKLNRYSSMVIDSDKTKARMRIKGTKKRLKDEFDSGPGFAWITKGREIENYLGEGDLESSIRAVHPKFKRLVARGQWANLLEYHTGHKERRANKVKVARHYTSHFEADLKVLDLKKQIRRLQRFIRQANGVRLTVRPL